MARVDRRYHLQTAVVQPYAGVDVSEQIVTQTRRSGVSHPSTAAIVKLV
jgi:hypothetical protein